MPEFDTAIHGNITKSTVDLEVTQEDLANILQLHDIDAPPPLRWEEAASALEAGEQYGFLSLPTHLAAKSVQLAAKWPWPVFVFAARHDFFLLAKHAIVFFYPGLDDHNPPQDYPAARFKDVPGDYVTALFQAIGPKYMTVHPCAPMWREISGRFKLNVRGEQGIRCRMLLGVYWPSKLPLAALYPPSILRPRYLPLSLTR